MPINAATQQIIAESGDLRARLAHAKASLGEMQSGEVDALVVSDMGGVQLLAPADADQSFRTLIEKMSEGALMLTPAGLILYANRRFAAMLGAPLEKVIGSEIHTWVPAERRPALLDLLRKDEVDHRREESALASAGGAQVPVHLSVSHLVLNEHDSVCMVVTDLTEQKRNAAILAAEQLSNAMLAENVRQREQHAVELQGRNAELADLNARLGEAHGLLLQNEKMASIGLLAAGIAHEINNPICFVQSNMGSLESTLDDLFRIIDAYAATEGTLPADAPTNAALQRLKAELDLDFLREDSPRLMAESRDGIARVSKIVRDLLDFSHVDSSPEWKRADLHRGLDSTITVANNEIKYRADVVKEYGTLPEIECLPSELNQVFLNLLVNAAQAIPDGKRGTITLRSDCDDKQVWIEVTDTGSGIAPENLKHVFDPFFTTKSIGKGTGLGLSLAYGIIKKHGGSIEVDSEVGKGSSFRVILPISQTHEEVATVSEPARVTSSNPERVGVGPVLRKKKVSEQCPTSP